VTAILAGPGVSNNFSGKLGQAEGIVKFAKGEQTSIGRNSRTVEFQLQAGVESDPESGILFFTRCPVHLQPR
jgi:hypothetical protein